MKKFPSIKRIGDAQNNGILESGKLAIQEKLDGANFRFMAEQHFGDEYRERGRNLVFGSRNVCYKNERDRNKTFDHAVEFVRDNANIPALLEAEAGCGPLVLYGEAMHPHTFDYDWDNTPSFLGFDVYSVDREQFLEIELVEELFEKVGLPTVPLLYTGEAVALPETLLDEKTGVAVPESEYRNGVAEGVVIKNEDTGQRAKVRSQEFRERHKSSHASKEDTYEPDDATVLAHQYTTEARVIKWIHKYRDRGVEIEMGIMEDLWREIFDDIIEEEYEEILLGNHKIDTKQFRSEVAGITADVLQSYIQRPTDSVLNQ